MMVFTVLLLIGLASGRPKNQEEVPDVWDIVHCWGENWGQEQRISDCRTCFKDVGENPLSETGLPKAKQCIKDYLPEEFSGCEKEISALTVGNEKAGMEVLTCMDKTFETMGLDFCLDFTKTDDVVDHLTDASMCIMHGHKEAMEYVKNETKSSGGKPHKGHDGKIKKGKIMRLLMKAHCGLATNGDSAKNQACKQCFNNAVKSAKSGGKEAMMANILQCSQDHLEDLYNTCTELMAAGNMEEAHKCYGRVLVRDQVTKCTDDSTVATAQTLKEVMGCTKRATIEWVKKNASKKLADKISNMLEADDDFDEDFSEEDLE